MHLRAPRIVQDEEEYMMDSDLEDELFAMVNNNHMEPGRQSTQVPPPQTAAAGRYLVKGFSTSH